MRIVLKVSSSYEHGDGRCESIFPFRSATPILRIVAAISIHGV
jgi:hypothetical protein